MTFFAYDRWGASIQSPSHEKMRELLESLAASDGEHPDVSLNHESGWCLSAFRSGLLVWENVEDGYGPWHMRDVSKEKILSLWQKLSRGEITGIQSELWQDGYG